MDIILVHTMAPQKIEKIQGTIRQLAERTRERRVNHLEQGNIRKTTIKNNHVGLLVA